MASVRERYARLTREGRADTTAWKTRLRKAAALGDAGAAEELRLLNHFEARARGDFRTAPNKKASLCSSPSIPMRPRSPTTQPMFRT